MTDYETELYEAINKLSEVLYRHGERVREVVITPHLRPPMTLETVGGSVLVLFGDNRASPWQRAIHAQAGLQQALKDADLEVERIGKELDADRLKEKP